MTKKTTNTKKKTLAAAKKAADTPAYATTGPLAAGVEKDMRFCMQSTPSELHAIRASLLAFEDVLTGGCCGKDDRHLLGDDGTGSPFFMVSARDPQSDKNEYEFIITSGRIVGQLAMHDSEDGTADYDTPFAMTLAGLHNFLRQLPRHANAFAIG
jgi:hypothetical protein